MRRRKRYLDNRESDNHERWLVSYADFITLLFAFFVVMYAISSVNEGKYRVLSDAMVGAFQSKITNPDAAQQGALPAQQFRSIELIARRNEKAAEQQRKQREQMRELEQDLLKALGSLVQEGQVRVTQTSRGISVEISAQALFASGQAQLRPDTVRALQQVAKVLAGNDRTLQIEGHSDNVPISTALFPSNWELSSARASSLARLFIDNGVAEARLSVIGYGPNRPVDSNDTPEGKARNRRVNVMILEEAPPSPSPAPGRKTPDLPTR